MENEHNTYRNIIENAVLMGILSKEDDIYLSAIREETENELSELESYLNMKDHDSDSDLNQENRHANKILLITEEKNFDPNEQTDMASFYSDSSISVLSKDTVENCSILSVESCDCKTDTIDDSTSDASSIRQHNLTPGSTKNVKSTSVSPKFLKKTIKERLTGYDLLIKTLLINSETNTDGNEQIKSTLSHSDNSTSMFSGDTIENYDTFDIKSSKYENDSTDNSTSDACSIRQQSVISEAAQNVKYTNALFKTPKKPIKGQFLDFNVPIYINSKETKGYKIKSNAHDLTQCNSLKQYTGKSNRLQLRAKGKGGNFYKWTHPKTETSFATKRDLPFKSANNFKDTIALTNYINESMNIEDTAEEYQIEDECSKENESFFSETKVIEHHQKNSVPKSKCIHQAEPHETKCCDSQTHKIKCCDSQTHKIKCCDSQTHATNTNRKFKTRNDAVNIQLPPRKQDSFSVNFKVCENKSEAEKLMCMQGKIGKCKCPDCHWNCKSDFVKVLNDAKAAESSNEDDISHHGISICRKKHEALINVNIVCQFHDDDVTKNRNIQNFQNTNSLAQVPLAKTEISDEHVSKNEKNKKDNKMHRLSKLFTSMKIKKK